MILYRGCVAEMGATDKIYDNPLHPYTSMFMAAVPRLDEKWEETEVELKAKHTEFSGGCVYYGKYPVADKDLGCDRYMPPLLEAECDHFVACFRYAEA